MKQPAHKRLQRKLSKVTAVSPASIRLSADGRTDGTALGIAITGVKGSFGLADNQSGLKDGHGRHAAETGSSRSPVSDVCVCCN